MRRLAATLVLGIGGLLLTPGAPGVPLVPGDPSPPNVTPLITGTLGSAGWYTSNVTVSWSVTDPESIILSTTGCDTRTLTADSASTRLTCMAVSDGGETTITKTFQVDKTAPAASTSVRPADVNGWYNRELTVDFAGVDATSGLASCSPPRLYNGPDTAGTLLAGTCRDVAGNTAPASFLVKYDQTAPLASPEARLPDAGGWYNHAVTVTFRGTDAASGVESCSQATYQGPDDPSAALSGTCRDRAGNVSLPSIFALRYDETAPAANATADRQADANGWYNRPLTVTFSGSDATSGPATCDAPQTYSAPDTKSTSVNGACRDQAGNVAQRSLAFRYDRTAPQVTATPARQPNANDWYNAALQVSFNGADPISGVVSCSAPRTYSSPDSLTASLGGTCLDEAGNLGSGSLAIKYDATPPVASATPSRQPNANGWYNASLEISFAATDNLSGPGSCTATHTYSGPDSSSVSRSGTCLDRAGNVSAPASFGFSFDATAPQASATPSRQPNANGWYRAPLTVSFAATDAMSGFDSCPAAQTYAGPDSATAAVSGTCRDRAGNGALASFAVKYDATAPQASATASRQPNVNGWYNAPLQVSFAATDAMSGFDSCPVEQTYSGPDSAAAVVSGTCVDRAGNGAPASLPVKYDATRPVSAGAPARAANANGWYNAPLPVAFTGSDATSGVDTPTCTQANYSGPDSATASVSGSCRDQAGNQSVSSAFSFRYDATAPAVTATPARGADVNGWYNRALSVSFSGGDAASGLESCDAPRSYSGPDSPSVSIGGGCRDRAGNHGSGSVAIAYDATGPAASATPSRQPNPSGWYSAPLTVSFAASDPVSGFGSCPAQQSYGGPDSVSAVVSGTCRDNAGNGTLASLAIKYDATNPQVGAVPSRPPNGNGWFNSPLTVAFPGSDLTSGIETCTASQPYAGPDAGGASLSGSCRDRAGNASPTASYSVKYDATAPVVTQGVAVRAPDRAGWYNKPVAFAVQGTDATSGIDSCPAESYAGPDRADASFSGTCVDKAGNRGTKLLPLSYDGTGPQVVASPSRGPDSSGWYNHPLAVSFAGSDAVAGLESCADPESYGGPDSATAVVSGICLDKAGNPGVGSLDLRYDGTAPQVTGATPDRQPDAGGWYNHPLAVTFRGSDATSAIEACTQARYAGPDAGAASVGGSCRDRAGNGSAPASFALRYDATPPSLTGATAKAGNGTAELSWTASADTALVEIRRSGAVVYRGAGRSFKDTRLKNGVPYRYRLTAYDEARNAATRDLVTTPTGPLVSPRTGATVSAPPRLVWKPAKKATYYNVQVWRGGKIFSAWPAATSLQLKRTWTYAGRRYRLSPGRYRWYVWPGLGRRAEKRFGPSLGSSSFVVR